MAERVLEKREAAFELLAENPGGGHAREDITRGEGLRFWPVGPSLVAYRRVEDGVEILFVERGECDWDKLGSVPEVGGNPRSFAPAPRERAEV